MVGIVRHAYSPALIAAALLLLFAGMAQADTQIVGSSPVQVATGRGIAVNGSTIYALYLTSGNDLYVARSTDSGLTWNSTWSPRLNNQTAGASSCDHAEKGGSSLKVVGAYIHVAFGCNYSYSTAGKIGMWYARLDASGTVLNHTMISPTDYQSASPLGDVEFLANGTGVYLYKYHIGGNYFSLYAAVRSSSI